VDNASARWLADEARQAGADVSLEPFSVSRVDPQLCYLRTGEHRIDAVPLFDAGFTGPEGVEGWIGPLGSDAEIALVESQKAELGEPGTAQHDQVAEARRSRHRAVVVLTPGAQAGTLPAQRFRFPQTFWSAGGTDIQLMERVASGSRGRTGQCQSCRLRKEGNGRSF
jgi:hypothetical protein